MSNQIQLQSMLQQLKLNGILDSLESRLRQARDADMSYEELLMMLLEDETDLRKQEAISRRVKQAKFEELKTFEGFDLKRYSLKIRHAINDLMTGKFLKEKHHIIIMGPVGTGKTHLSQALGMLACQRNQKVKFCRSNELLHEFYKSRADNSYDNLLKRYTKVNVVILDDFGLKTLSAEQSSDLYDLIASIHINASLIITTNRKIEKWSEIFFDPVMANAALDRIVNNSYRIVLEGDSYRKKFTPKFNKEDDKMSAPRKVRKEQSVKIRPMQRLTISIEPTIALQEVTNVMKPVGGTYQAATQVKVLSSEIYDIVEADVFHCAEGSMKGDVMVSHHLLYRGRSPWHDMRWNLRKLGRSFVFSKEYAGTSQKRQGLANDAEEFGLTDSTRSMGKPCTWGSGQQWNVWLSTIQNNTQRL